MVNVPKEIEKLYKTGSVKKRYVFSFPNGERDDITNENLISESVSFTESICSKDELVFGLIESPVLEFETAGVENIKGMEIEASIEIEASGKTIEEIFTLENNRVQFEIISDGEVRFYGYNSHELNVSVDLPDHVGFPFFSIIDQTTIGGIINTRFCILDLSRYKGERAIITVSTKANAEKMRIQYDYSYYENGVVEQYFPIKLGRFIVKDCPKQADMSRRKVTAYGLSYSSFNQLSSVEQAKRNVECTKKTPYRFDAEKFFYSCLVGNFEIPGATYNTFYNSSGSSSSILQWGDDTYFKYSFNWYVFGNELDEQELYRVKYNSEYTLETLKNAIAEYFEENHPSLKDNIISKFNLYGTGEKLFYPEMIYVTPYGFPTGLMKGQGYLYPYSSSGLSYDNYPRELQIPKTITIGNAELGDIVTFTLRENADISVEYVILENHTPIWLEIPRKKDGSYYKVAEQLHYPLEVAEGLLETKGSFGLYNRNGSFDILRLGENFKNVNGDKISKSECKSIWYEDKQSYPYGIVSAAYTNTSGEEEYAVYNIPKSVDILDKVVVTSAQPTSGTSVSLRFEQANVEGYYVESPYPIESVEVVFESGAAMSLPFEIEPGATEFLITNELLQEQGMREIEYLYSIDITFEAPTEYSGTFYVSSCTPTNVYYKADECIQYDISNNYLIQNSTFTSERIIELLKNFGESIQNIQYMPCELEMLGLPYIESGDVIEVETNSGNFITFVERRTLSGIQSLTDEFESKTSNEPIFSGEKTSSGGGGSSSGGGGESAVTSVNGYVGNVVLKTSDLVNDSNYVSDSEYVHTDNNFTAAYKTKVDSNTTARHTHSNKTVLDSITQAQIDKWNEGGSGGGDPTIRYNAETDMIQLFGSDGIWHDWMSGGLKATMLYDNGVQNVQFDLGHVWRYNSYSYKDSVAEESSINITGTSGAGSSVTGTTNVIDITDYNTLVYEVTNDSVSMTLEVDISDLTGSYYIGFGYRYADKEVVYGVTSSKNIGTGSVRTLKKAVSAHTTYINEIKLIK